MQDHFEPSAVDELVALIKKNGTTDYTGVLFPVHTRLHIDVFGLLQAITEHSGLSRNQMVNRLLRVGIDATLEALPSELAQQLLLRSGHFTKLDKATEGAAPWESGRE